MLKADGFDDAIMGVCSICDKHDRLVYDYDDCVKILMDRDGMTWEEAVEYLEFNVLGAYVGEETPAFIRMLTMEEAMEIYGEDS